MRTTFLLEPKEERLSTGKLMIRSVKKSMMHIQNRPRVSLPYLSLRPSQSCSEERCGMRMLSLSLNLLLLPQEEPRSSDSGSLVSSIKHFIHILRLRLPLLVESNSSLRPKIPKLSLPMLKLLNSTTLSIKMTKRPKNKLTKLRRTKILK